MAVWRLLAPLALSAHSGDRSRGGAPLGPARVAFVPCTLDVPVTRTAAKLQYEVSGYDRGSRHGATNRRGKAAIDRQLGRVQVKILRWLLAEEVRLDLVGDERQRRSVSRRGVPWVKVDLKVVEHPGSVSAALRGEGQRSLVQRGLVVLSMSSGGRVTHVKLTTLGRATAEATTPGRSPRTIRDSIRRRYVDQHGPRSEWSDDLKLDEQKDVEDALLEVYFESLRLGRPEKNLSYEEFLPINEAATREWEALAPKRRKSSAHFNSIFVRHVLEYVEQRDKEESCESSRAQDKEG